MYTTENRADAEKILERTIKQTEAGGKELTTCSQLKMVSFILWECQLKPKQRDLTLKGLERTLH